jgi:hypothetical protein
LTLKASIHGTVIVWGSFEYYSQESRIKNVKARRGLQDPPVHLPCFTDGEWEGPD